MAHFVVVVTGLLAEARLAQPLSGRAIAGGGDRVRLEAELDRALEDGAQAVLSFGLAGGLAPQRPPGTLLVPTLVISGSEHYRTDARWTQAMRCALGAADPGPVAGVDSPLFRPIDKAGLHKATGAVAADMESHLVARLALRARRPFAVLRVIGDPAERALPPAALIGMRPDGHVNLAAVLASLLRNPRQLPDLMRVAIDVRIAMSALTRCRRALGPQLGWVTADRTAGSAVR